MHSILGLQLGCNPWQPSLYHHHTNTRAQETTQQRCCQTNRFTLLPKGRRDFPPILDDLNAWTEALEQKFKRCTHEVTLTDDQPAVDGHLLLIREARRNVTKRWKHQRHNKTLRKRVALLSIQAKEYAFTLHRQKRFSLCDQLKGTLSSKRTWHLLRHLLDSTTSRTQSNQQIQTYWEQLPSPERFAPCIPDQPLRHATT